MNQVKTREICFEQTRTSPEHWRHVHFYACHPILLWGYKETGFSTGLNLWASESLEECKIEVWQNWNFLKFTRVPHTQMMTGIKFEKPNHTGPRKALHWCFLRSCQKWRWRSGNIVSRRMPGIGDKSARGNEMSRGSPINTRGRQIHVHVGPA